MGSAVQEQQMQPRKGATSETRCATGHRVDSVARDVAWVYATDKTTSIFVFHGDVFPAWRLEHALLSVQPGSSSLKSSLYLFFEIIIVFFKKE